jgi:hypothetical protein
MHQVPCAGTAALERHVIERFAERLDLTWVQHARHDLETGGHRL